MVTEYTILTRGRAGDTVVTGSIVLTRGRAEGTVVTSGTRVWQWRRKGQQRPPTPSLPIPAAVTGHQGQGLLNNRHSSGSRKPKVTEKPCL